MGITPYLVKSYVAANQAAQQPFARLGQNVATMIDYQKSNLTDDIKEYNLAKSQGYDEDFNTFLINKKRAGAINLNMGKTIGDAAFESMNTAIANAQQISQKASTGLKELQADDASL